LKNENEALGELSVDIPCYFDHLTFTCFIIFIQFDFPSDGNNQATEISSSHLGDSQNCISPNEVGFVYFIHSEGKGDLTYTLTRYLF